MPDMGIMIIRLIAGPLERIQLLLVWKMPLRMQADKRGNVSTGGSGGA